MWFQENAAILIAVLGSVFGVTGFVSIFWRIDWLFQVLTVATAIITIPWFIVVVILAIRDHMELESE